MLKAVDIAACSTPVWKDALLALGKTSTDVLAPVLRVGIYLSGTPVLSYVQRFIERERGVYALPLVHQVLCYLSLRNPDERSGALLALPRLGESAKSHIELVTDVNQLARDSHQKLALSE